MKVFELERVRPLFNRLRLRRALPLVGKNPLLLEVDRPNHTLNSDRCHRRLPGRPLCLATGRNYICGKWMSAAALRRPAATSQLLI